MMRERSFIIHGYLGYPEEAWLPWLKAKLEKRCYQVWLSAMPHPDRPVIPEWVNFIAKLVGEPDAKTVMIAHSLGCQGGSSLSRNARRKRQVGREDRAGGG